MLALPEASDRALELKLGTLMQYRPAVLEPFLEEAETGEELLVFGNPDLDLSSYLAEMTLLGSPLSVLHDPHCKGLCQVLVTTSMRDRANTARACPSKTSTRRSSAPRRVASTPARTRLRRWAA